MMNTRTTDSESYPARKIIGRNAVHEWNAIVVMDQSSSEDAEDDLRGGSIFTHKLETFSPIT